MVSVTVLSSDRGTTFKSVLFIVWRRAEIAFGLVLYRVPCQCRPLAWPCFVINRKVCSAELE